MLRKTKKLTANAHNYWVGHHLSPQRLPLCAWCGDRVAVSRVFRIPRAYCTSCRAALKVELLSPPVKYGELTPFPNGRYDPLRIPLTYSHPSPKPESHIEVQ